MSRAHFKPGPLPKSCLTCRQRRKKCDLTRPSCERCKKGGFKCLGYAGRGTHANMEGEGFDTPTSSRPQPPALLVTPMLKHVPECTTDFDLRQSPATDVVASKEHSRTGSICREYDLTSWIADTSANAIAPATLIDHSYSTPPSEYDDYSLLRDSAQGIAWPYSPPRWRLDQGGLHVASDEQSPESCLSKIIRDLCASIPPSVDAPEMAREESFVYIINEYQIQRVNYWFTIPPAPVRNSMMKRLGGSKAMIWAMNLSAKLFKELGENPDGVVALKCISWIDKLEEKFGSYFHNSTTLQDAGDCLLAQLELAFLRFASINVISGYTVLQKALSKFLYLVATHPDLYMEHPDGNLVVSFPRALSSPQYEIKRFLMYDTATALVLGVSPLVEYGYDGECNTASHGLEWVHGVPIALAEVIAQVNSWRAGSRVAPLDDWETLERRALIWEPELTASEGDNSRAEMVARLAVQEGWRHVTLIYIYMGMCGVSSHDSRVQKSIRQIVKLGRTVANLPIGVHMFMHCIVVGIAARYETHRSMVKDRLLSFKGTQVWFFRGPEFSPVLENLWHGVGAGGSPVTWDDYVRSRCIMLPI